MRKVWIVARTEYLSAIRSKAFILGVIMLPVLMFGAIAVQVLVKDAVDIRDRRFAVVDPTGRLYSVIERKARERNDGPEVFESGEGGDGGKQIQPRFLPEEYRPGDVRDNSNRTDLLLSDRVRKEELFAFLIIGEGVFSLDPGGDRSIVYQSETPTYRDLLRWLRSTINEEIQRSRFEEATIDRQLVERLTRTVSIENVGLVALEKTGEVKEAEKTSDLITFGIPFVSMFLLFMMVMSSAPTLMNTVLEEKMQKIAELLVSAVSPFQLLLGKLLGAVFVSMTLSVLYLGALIFVAHRAEILHLVPPQMFFWFLFFQLLALLMFGSIFSAIGAACNEMRDAQSMMFPAMMVIMIPLFCWMPVLQAPSSLFARLISLFPPATPMLMMLRIAVPPGAELWEVILGAVFTTIFMLGCVWAAARIFRIGILSQGQTPTLRRLIQWVIKG